VDHIRRPEIRLFLGGSLEPERFRLIFSHLVTGCSTCRARLAGPLRALLDPGPRTSAPSPSELEMQERPVQRAFARARAEAPKARAEQARLAEILRQARASREGISGLPADDLHGWPLVEALLELSYEERFRDPGEMLFLAFAATVAAGNLDQERYSPGFAADLQARAWIEAGNAYRVNDDFESAESAFHRAAGVLDAGTGDLRILARLLVCLASLRRAQRRLTDAAELLDSAQRLYVEIGEDRLASRTAIKMGVVLHYDDRPREAVSTLQLGLAGLDAEADRQLVAIGRQTLVHALVDCGEPRKASEILLRGGLRQAFAGQPLNLAKLRWVEGKVLAGLGKLRRAERALAEVRQGYLALGLMYDAAMAGLDLAGVWIREGKAAQARELTSDLVHTFRDLDVPSEANKAVRYLQRACDRALATAELVESIARFLRRLERNPQLRFTP
jgi:tetratricopeptide (TPR) repeat protein